MRVLGGHSGPSLLIIGGLDPLGGSGVLADMRAIDGLSLRPLVCVSALTVQSGTPLMVTTEHRLFAATLRAQLALRPDAIKIGMLANVEQVRTLCRLLPKSIPLVVDPVQNASSGVKLYQDDPATLWPLLRRASLITPNLPEARRLIGTSEAESSHEALARQLFGRKPHAVLLKGGHAEHSTRVVDHLFEKSGYHKFSHRRLPYEARGTGCALATRIAAEMALGRELKSAVAAAERWLGAAYRNAATWR